jgi:hypothetical protein
MAVACTWDSGTITAGHAGTASCTGIDDPTLLDWLGLHKVGDPDGKLAVWRYTNDPAVAASLLPGTTNGSYQFIIPSGTAAGSYTVRLYRGIGGFLLAESAAFTINAYDNSISVSGPTSVSRNTTVSVTWAGSPAPSAADFVGLFTPGARDADAPIAAALALPAAASGSVSLAIPNTVIPGTYEYRLVTARTQTHPRLATSAAVTVDTSAQPTIASPGDQLAGTQVLAAWANIVSPAPSTQDWVGLFALGAPASAPLGNRYLNGTASGSLPFVIPGYLPTDTYELRLYSGTDQALLATSDPFTVTAAP